MRGLLLAAAVADVGHEALPEPQVALYALLVVLLVLGAGAMSGLTLGLLSLDVMELEVLKASGSAKQQADAARLLPLVACPHWLLCTLLLCNAACMEALPLFLDRLLNPLAALLLSLTAILVFGEIVPQAVCSRHGITIGAAVAPLVRGLMWLCSPVTWPLGKLLDAILGHEEPAMQRRELKAMLQLHTEAAGLGGKLTPQEVAVLHGALDLRCKTALSAMTSLDQVFMLPDDAVLDAELVQAILDSGHSRVPIFKAGRRSELVGLILAKEILRFWRASEPAPRLAELCLRRLPRLPAETRMLDVLAYFKTGSSHMLLLTAPEGADVEELRRTRAFILSRDEDAGSSGGGSEPPPAQHVQAPPGTLGSCCEEGADAAASGEDGSSRQPRLASWLRLSTGGRTGAQRITSLPLTQPAGKGQLEQRAEPQDGSSDGSTPHEAGALRPRSPFAAAWHALRAAGTPPQQPRAPARATPCGASQSQPGGGSPMGAGKDSGQAQGQGQQQVAVGIITLEDVMEQLLDSQIHDETDCVDRAALLALLPPHLQALLHADAAMHATQARPRPNRPLTGIPGAGALGAVGARAHSLSHARQRQPQPRWPARLRASDPGAHVARANSHGQAHAPSAGAAAPGLGTSGSVGAAELQLLAGGGPAAPMHKASSGGGRFFKAARGASTDSE